MTVISCKKVTKVDGEYITCTETDLSFSQFKKEGNALNIVLECKDKHKNFFQLSELRETSDKSIIHDILASSKSKYAVCNLTKGNKCTTDDEKATCLEQSYNNYKNK